MNKKNIIVLYDKDDVLEFNFTNKDYKKVFLFSPGLEIFLKNKEELDIYRPNTKLNHNIHKKVILESEKIYKEYQKNFHYLKKLDKGVIENIHNILFVTIFSFMYLIENLKDYKNLGLFHKNKFHNFHNFDYFIPIFLEKIFFKKSQGFFNYLKPKKLSKLKKILIKLNNIVCHFNKRSNNVIIVGSSLTKKLYKKTKKKVSITQIKPSYEFKFYHLALNIFAIFNIFKKKNCFYFFPLENKFLKNDLIKNNLEVFFNNLKEKKIKYFKNIILNPLLQYCENQINLKNDIIGIIGHLKPKNIFVDQLRFGVATILASICFSKKINVILVPHGSISVPDSELSKFVLTICARGLIYSKIANYSVAQSKISYEAIKYYDDSLKILKSEPILYGTNFTKKFFNKKNQFTFLHASTPKSLSKWPWIYENYNEYIANIKSLIQELCKFKDVRLLIRFREGPECDLKTFKKLINIKKYNFINISLNKNFFEDLNESNCLISYSSTAIEESLLFDKKVLIYSNNKNYKHINYHLSKNSIYYASNENASKIIKQVLNDKSLVENNILWDPKNTEENTLINYI